MVLPICAVVFCPDENTGSTAVFEEMYCKLYCSFWRCPDPREDELSKSSILNLTLSHCWKVDQLPGHSPVTPSGQKPSAPLESSLHSIVISGDTKSKTKPIIEQADLFAFSSWTWQQQFEVYLISCIMVVSRQAAVSIFVPPYHPHHLQHSALLCLPLVNSDHSISRKIIAVSYASTLWYF